MLTLFDPFSDCLRASQRPGWGRSEIKSTQLAPPNSVFFSDELMLIVLKIFHNALDLLKTFFRLLSLHAPAPTRPQSQKVCSSLMKQARL